MLHTAASDRAKPAEGRIDGSFAERSGWSPVQANRDVDSLRIFVGDDVSGPLVWLFATGVREFPEGEARPEFAQAQAHYHRSPTFRVALGPQPKQFKFDQQIFGSGDYIFLDANRFYQDPFGVDGAEVLMIFADRRGFHPTNRKIADLASSEIIEMHDKVYGKFGKTMTEVNMTDEAADKGLFVNALGAPRAGRLAGHLDDSGLWQMLTDGSQVAAAILGQRLEAPLLLLSKNAPNTVESEEGIAKTDLFRIITGGSCQIGERTMRPGDFIAIEAGQTADKVMHGPEGSTQLLLAADHRRWRIADGSGSGRQDEIADVIPCVDMG